MTLPGTIVRPTVKAHSLMSQRPVPKQTRSHQLRATLAKTTNRSNEKSSEDSVIPCRAREDTGVVTLPDDDPEVFATYIQLLYTSTLSIFEHPKTDIRGASPDEIDKAEKKVKTAISSAVAKETAMLGHLYVLAEKLGYVDAKCSAMSAMVESAQTRRADGLCHFAPLHVIKSVYAGTKPLDPMRKFLTNVALMWWHADWPKNATSEEYHHEYLFDVVVAMGEDRVCMLDTAAIRHAENAASYCEELRRRAKKQWCLWDLSGVNNGNQ